MKRNIFSGVPEIITIIAWPMCGACPFIIILIAEGRMENVTIAFALHVSEAKLLFALTKTTLVFLFRGIEMDDSEHMDKQFVSASMFPLGYISFMIFRFIYV